MQNVLEGPKQEYNVELSPSYSVHLTVYGPKRVRFHFLAGDRDYLTYGGKWISNKQSNGEFDYYFVIELLNWVEAVSEREVPAQYNVSLSVVSPQEAGEENVRRTLDCCGIDETILQTATDNGYRDELLAEALHSYGTVAPVWGENGNNAKQLLREARRQAQPAESLFGCVMDRPVNQIGTTGWEALRGNITASLTKAGT